MQLNQIKIYLITNNEKSFLVLDEHPDIMLQLTDDGTANIEEFFSEMINLLLKTPFKLMLVQDEESPRLVMEVANKYVERLNEEIDNILELPEYSFFQEI